MYTTTAVNVRKKKSIKSKIITTLPKGKKVKVKRKGKKWNTVIIKKKKYYIYNKYLSNEKPKEDDVENARYTPSYFKRMGVIYWGGYRWTWYSQRVLPGGGLRIPGRHVGSGGYVMDKDGRICLASSTLSKGTIVNTPFGAKGCIYDSGCAVGTLDVYVDW